MTFYEKMIEGRIKPEDIAEYVNFWVSERPEMPLVEFLGMPSELFVGWGHGGIQVLKDHLEGINKTNKKKKLESVYLRCLFLQHLKNEARDMNTIIGTIYTDMTTYLSSLLQSEIEKATILGMCVDLLDEVRDMVLVALDKGGARERKFVETVDKVYEKIWNRL